MTEPGLVTLLVAAGCPDADWVSPGVTPAPLGQRRVFHDGHEHRLRPDGSLGPARRSR